jgi:hypothetical protein
LFGRFLLLELNEDLHHSQVAEADLRRFTLNGVDPMFRWSVCGPAFVAGET